VLQCPVHLILDLITRIIFGEEYRLTNILGNFAFKTFLCWVNNYLHAACSFWASCLKRHGLHNQCHEKLLLLLAYRRINTYWNDNDNSPCARYEGVCGSG
jgi:hypothetical protein